MEIETVALGAGSCDSMETARDLGAEILDRREKVAHTSSGGQNRSGVSGTSDTDMVGNEPNAAASSAGSRVIGKLAVAFVPAASALVDAFALAHAGVSAVLPCPR